MFISSFLPLLALTLSSSCRYEQSEIVTASRFSGMSPPQSVLPGVEALTFDVFGTVVDWHGSVVRAVKAKAAKAKGIDVYSDEGNHNLVSDAWAGLTLMVSHRLV